MSSAAFADFLTRMEEPRYLIREALETSHPIRATALSKGAAVLAAAALERYINDVVIELCARLKVNTWGELTEGQQRYMARQMSRLLYLSAARILKKGKVSAKYRMKLLHAVQQSQAAFGSPASWPHLPDYGMFMEGAAEPKRVDATLRLFDEQGRGLFNFIASRGRDAQALARALSSLIDARHQCAHALRSIVPGPSDVRLWIVLTSLLAREIEVYLGFRT